MPTSLSSNTSYDYIVVGSGSAGSIVAGRLAAETSAQVLLLEAGTDASTYPSVWDPNQINCLYGIDEIHWGYKSTPQAQLNNRILDVWRAKITGGCTAHNDMVYTRGAPGDFDDWASTYGCSGWSYSEVVGNFEAVEAQLGPSQTVENDFASSFIGACQQLEIPYNPNYNSGQTMQGVSPLQSTIDTSGSSPVRTTSYERYVAPLLPRGNLTVVTGALVTGITFSGVVATGVRCVVGGVPYTLSATTEVVLSAGAINTPQLLMLSGIGDADTLMSLGIPVVANLSGVGQNLQNAIIFLGSWSTSQPIYNQPSNEGYAIVWDNLEDQNQPQTCLEMMRGRYTCNQSPTDLESYYSVTGGAMRLQSKGSVTLASTDPTVAPIIDPQLLTAPGDWEQCFDAFYMMREVGNSDGLASWRKAEVTPGPGVSTPSEIEAWLRANISTYSHPVGTCAMGSGSAAVVTPDLKVQGVSGLRVIDVSVMPRITSGHTQGPAFMIGDKGADLLLGTS